ncbi:MAG: glyceraldehyde-3-phosphate dehydrogenase [Archaeoglobus sp.]|uniref:Glyceraldehyde-3-phosphate dehydrogenase n=2 Tax=Archaeoglobaceae TaxID=2232 RepID=A0A075WMG7_ARCFL|nr:MULTISPECIES: type II glyceraldehyde-3-phosphate dehydrogenase [Archaeoglobus]AIG98733.1 glyceraldehyde-3-phosphate dehydrogenase, type II [Archaeoglobus fulgidus DSM 8774]MDI3497228.1 glyceraldehyde-3-phosphate dehydrogenase [Archaeoglobus sp.]
MMKVKVAINGYGTIGKRVADAVSLQDDMEVVGVTKTRPDFEAKLGAKRYPLYVAKPENVELFERAGIEIQGTIEDLLPKADIVVDCSPNKVGAENKAKYYEKAGIKAIFQGGEKKDVAEVSFNALANYDEAVGKSYVRVVSCNTTGLTRLIYMLKTNFSIGRIRATMLRRVVDPKEDKKGLVNGIMPDPVAIPSHHGPDVKTVLPDVDIVTTAFKLPTTLMHVHSLCVEMREAVNAEDVVSALSEEPRIMLISAEDGFTSTAKVIEFARELRLRYDLYENIVWRESIGVDGNDLFVTQAVHQEAIVVPENIDAIRAMFELAEKEESIRKTNESLGIGKVF